MGHRYPVVNLDDVQPVADMRDHAYMLDRRCVMMIWAKSLPRAEGLQYSATPKPRLRYMVSGVPFRLTDFTSLVSKIFELKSMQVISKGCSTTRSFNQALQSTMDFWHQALP